MNPGHENESGNAPSSFRLRLASATALAAPRHAHLWLRHDAARWLKPGSDPAEVFPELKRQREAAEAAKESARAAEDAAFDAWIENERRWIAAMREEVNELKAALARRRLEEAKYSSDQPRVPRGNSRGGQWTAGGSGGSIAQPMGSVAVGDLSGSSELTVRKDIAC